MRSFPSADCPDAVSSERPNQSSINRALHQFFEQRISELSGKRLPAAYANVSSTHLASVLVERTLARAALEGAVLSASGGGKPESGADQALRLKIAALTVLRSLDL